MGDMVSGSIHVIPSREDKERLFLFVSELISVVSISGVASKLQPATLTPHAWPIHEHHASLASFLAKRISSYTSFCRRPKGPLTFADSFAYQTI